MGCLHMSYTRLGTSPKLTTALDDAELPFLSPLAYSLMTTVSILNIQNQYRHSSKANHYYQRAQGILKNEYDYILDCFEWIYDDLNETHHFDY